MTGDEIKAILAGGLRSYLDYGSSAPANVQADNRAEQTPPVARPTDRDTANASASTSFWSNMGPVQYAIAGVGALVVGVVLFASIKALGK